MKYHNVAKKAASALLKTLAVPVGWWDDALGNRLKILGWARSTLVCVAQEIIDQPCEEEETPTSTSAAPEPDSPPEPEPEPEPEP